MKLQKLLIAFVLGMILMNQGHTETYKNIAIFALDGKVYFSKELDQKLNSLKKFACLSKESVLWKGLKLNEISFDGFGEDLNAIKKDKLKIQKLVSFYQLKTFSHQIYKTLKKGDIQNIPGHSCLGDSKRWSRELNSILLLELYLRDRFIINGRIQNKKIGALVDSLKKKESIRYYF